MYLHLGQDTVITLNEIVGIFDIDTTTVSKTTRDYLSAAEKGGRAITVGTELPKSFILCNSKGSESTVYISPISPATLLKRTGHMDKIKLK